MNATIEDLRPTIVPKSDQLNAEQLLGGPMTVTVTDVRIGDSSEQPVIVHYDGEEGRPYKPCKTMRKLLIHAWGANGTAWVGKSMTLYNDPAVKFGGEDVGGIRISHMTDIERDIKVSLTATRGKKTKYEVRRLDTKIAHALGLIAAASTLEELRDAFDAAVKSARTKLERDQVVSAKDKRKAELQAAQPEHRTLADYLTSIDAATSAEAAELVLDQARDDLDATDQAALVERYKQRWSN